MDVVETTEDRRYTERDVRRSPELVEAAVEYLEGYTGDFEFLLDMHGRLATGRGLTNAMIKGVLNCMRYDASVDLPTMPDEEGEDAVVLPMRRRLRKVEPPHEPEICPEMGTEHNSHWFPCQHQTGRQHCLGWHAITRDITYTRARFHPDYVRGRTSNVIHRSTHEGEVCWFPDNFHAYGGVHVSTWRVGVVCPLPALKEPSLLTADEVKAAEPYEVHRSVRHKEITLCSRCFPTGG